MSSFHQTLATYVSPANNGKLQRSIHCRCVFSSPFSINLFFIRGLISSPFSLILLIAEDKRISCSLHLLRLKLGRRRGSTTLLNLNLNLKARILDSSSSSAPAHFDSSFKIDFIDTLHNSRS